MVPPKKRQSKYEENVKFKTVNFVVPVEVWKKLKEVCGTIIEPTGKRITQTKYIISLINDKHKKLFNNKNKNEK